MALSTWGQAAEATSRASPKWEVISHPWNPATNLDGYVNLGLAENSLMHCNMVKHIHDNIALTNPLLTYGEGRTGSERLKIGIS